MKEYYECHITIDPDCRSELWIQDVVQDELRWKFSAIDGDPDLGQGIKCYATMQYNTKYSKEDVIGWLDKAARILYDHGITVLRRKVELVIHDDRSSLEGENV